MKKKIVILGGGIGGLVVANQLRRKLSADNEIIVVDRESNHLFNPSLLWLMMGWRNKDDIQKPLYLLQKKGIIFLNAEVTKIDLEQRCVITSKKTLSFDYLVIALGAATFPENVAGFSEAAYNLYDLSGAELIKEKIRDFDKGKIVILISSLPFKCPAAPYEAALLLSAYFKNKKDVVIEVVTPETLPMPVAGTDVGNMVLSLLQGRRISFTPQHQVTKIDNAKREIIFQGGKVISFDLLIGIPAHGLPTVLKGLPLLGESGWVKVNSGTLETDKENVYAIGDVTAIPLPVGKPLPKAGVFAHYQAEVVAGNIVAKIYGRSPKKEFDGRGYCFIELGDGSAGYASGNFYADPKPMINLKKPSVLWHWGKVIFEKWWMWKWF